MLVHHHVFDRITFDPAQCMGKACLRGIRMPVASILRYLAAGMTSEQVLGEWPELEPEDMRQALAYAAEAAEEQVLPLEEMPSECSASSI